MEEKIKNEDRISRALGIKKKDDHFVSVLSKQYNYVDQGYFTTTTTEMEVFKKDFVEKQIEDGTKRIEKIEKDIKTNEELLAEYKLLVEDIGDKYEKVEKIVGVKKKYLEFSEQQDQFKASLEIEFEFLDHFKEMLSQWEE